MDNRSVTLFDLPNDNLKNEVANHLDADSIIHFCRSSTHAYALFQPEYKLTLSLLKKAFDHTAFGEWDDLDQLLQLFPDLLTCRRTIQHRGRYQFTECTLWEIALMNQEGDNERVRTLFEKHFKRLPNGLEEMSKQFHKVFPDGEMKKYNWDLEAAKKRVDDLFNGILQDKTLAENNPFKMNEVTNKLLQAFQNYVKPNPSDKFMKGLICDVGLFSYIWQKYVTEFNNFKNWDQRVFYGVQVWDYFVRLLPTGYLRPLCQGLYYVVYEKEPLSVNGCKLRTNDGIGSGASVLPLDADSHFVFGRDFINILGGTGGYANADGATRRAVRHWRATWISYVEQKQRAERTLCCTCSNNKTVTQQMRSGPAV